MRRPRARSSAILAATVAVTMCFAPLGVRAADSPEGAVHDLFDASERLFGRDVGADGVAAVVDPLVCAAYRDALVADLQEQTSELGLAGALAGQYPDADPEAIGRVLDGLSVVIGDRVVTLLSVEGDAAVVEGGGTMMLSFTDDAVRQLVRLDAQKLGEALDDAMVEERLPAAREQYRGDLPLDATRIDVVREGGTWLMCDDLAPDEPALPTLDPSAGGLGDVNAPVTATFDGRTYGYAIGTCEVGDALVRVAAQSADMRGSLNVHWPASDEGIPLARRQGSAGLGVWAASMLSLQADPWTIGTSISVTVTGSQAQVRAQMADMSTVTWDGTDQTPDIRDVAITIDCDEPAFGGAEPQPPSEVWPEPERPSGRLAVDLDGTTHEFTYLTTCSIGTWVTVEGASDEGEASLYQDSLNLFVGDARARDLGTTYQMGDQPLRTSIDGLSATATGMLLSPTGEQVPVSVAASCDPTGQEVYAAATLELAGQTHEFAFVTDQTNAPYMCTVSDTRVAFAGQTDASGTLLAVSPSGADGISTVAVHDATGSAYFADDAEFEVSGDRATWSGTLAAFGGEDQEVAVTVECRGPDAPAADG